MKRLMNFPTLPENDDLNWVIPREQHGGGIDVIGVRLMGQNEHWLATTADFESACADGNQILVAPIQSNMDLDALTGGVMCLDDFTIEHLAVEGFKHHQANADMLMKSIYVFAKQAGLIENAFGY